MGIFHCPLGVAFYDDEGCIDCGLCAAETQEEMVEASKKIRAFLKANGPNPGPVKKMVVCGKGGVGKSSLTTLLAGAFLRRGYRTCVLDTDESNPGLSRFFGFEKEPKSLITLLSRFSAGNASPGTEWLTGGDTLSLEDIPSEFILSHQNLKFMMVGKIKDPFQGCACSMADITRDLMRKLDLKEKEVIVVDMEAGVESFGRGVERNVDTVLIIVEPSYESMALAGKIVYMSEGMGICRVKAILNKVPSESMREKMTAELEKRGVQVAGTVRFDPELSEAGFEGREPGEGIAREDMAAIVRELLGETDS
ncbi:MAG: P-loop NTPase [Deltaproteobacteria bacterium]|nr:P-loop NTPase [Deltaproteobacteria bacterium]